MKKKGKKILIGSGIVAAVTAAATAASYGVTKILMNVALDRNQPKASEKSKKKVSGSTVPDQTAGAREEAAEKLRNSNCETIEITAEDGERLVGHWHECDKAERIIVAMHGWRSSWCRDFGAIADFWHENHCSVLYAEQRGQGESGGEYMGFGLTERHDCLDWGNWADEKNEEGLPIYLAGISMGAATVLMAAGLSLPENVHGIMADCGFTSPHDIWRHVVRDNLHLSYNSFVRKVATDMCKKKINVDPGEYSCVDAMKDCKVPVLFVHGSDDNFVPVQMTYENYKACAAPKRLLIVPGAEHAMSYLVDQESYERTVKQFWAEFDQKTTIENGGE